MYTVLLALYLLVAVVLIALILVQHGKGASMGASFGAGASNTVFGSVGNGNFLTHSTAVLACLFFVISLALTYMTAHQNKKSGDGFDDLQSVAEQQAAADANVNGIPTDNSAVNGDVPADVTTVPAA